MKDMGTRNHDTANDMINKAAKKVLGAKDFGDYVEQFHKDYTRDNPEPYN